jgi:hypothetical protein
MRCDFDVIESLFTAHCGNGGDYHYLSGFLPDCSERDHGYGHGWQ